MGRTLLLGRICGRQRSTMTFLRLTTLSTRVVVHELRRRIVDNLSPHRLLTHLTNAALMQESARRGASFEPVMWYAPSDDRKDPLLSATLAPPVLEHAQRTCYLIGAAAIASRSRDRVRLHHANYAAYNSLCPSESFGDQPVVVERNNEAYGDYGYTGYLIGPDAVLTCWHGWRDFSYEPQVAIFGYAISPSNNNPSELPAEDIVPIRLYPWIRPPKPQANSACEGDWVVLRLERPARHTLQGTKTRLTAPQPGRSVYTLGYPCGLPQKMANNATVLSTSHEGFRADLDTYSGNSGSPVFDALTHDLLGIIVAGQKGQGDFEAVPSRQCYVSNRIDHEISGQLAVSITCFSSALGKLAQGST